MKAKINLGVAVLLAAVFLFHPVAACAATWASTDPATHKCCSRKAEPAKASVTDCCMVSAPPTSPVELNAVESLVRGVLPHPTQLAYAPTETVHIGRLAEAFSPLYLFVKF